ncbi:argininosuccinate lyase [Gracilimonas sp.]|uniref:argininosuccinate lyase n=1 Tax=Gracilimonas sp. TaxID=1974203 RepID=UPI00287188D9|nr:argininosuccinate lyase [Gracilimonas sp.]
MSKLWETKDHKEKSEAVKKVEAFTVGNDYKLDQILLPYDIQASVVHANALKRAGMLKNKELEKLTSTLLEIKEIWEEGQFEILQEHEDMHTAIEVYLTEKLGDLGKKIHLGRSRNDQVLTAMRLYEKKQLSEISKLLQSLIKTLLEFGAKHEKIPLPGFTHTRKAMLSSVSLWAGGYAELLIMQLEMKAGVLGLIDRSPLGTAAGYGTTLPVDRKKEAVDLDFGQPMVCSTTAQLSRGWVETQLVQYLSSITSVLSRLASDIISYSSETHRFFTLDKMVCTGSSIMPQKQNPDVAELIRGKHAEQTGLQASLQSIGMNLGGGYHRDLQLTKEPVIRSFNITGQVLEMAKLLIESIEVNAEESEKACTQELFAAEAAYQIVKKEGLSFREAYKKVKENPNEIPEYSARDFLKAFSHLGSPGNTGLSILKAQLDRLGQGK